MMGEFVAVGLLLGSIMAASGSGDGATASSARLVPYEGPYAYGLAIAPPWADGGRLVINLPEHLEVWPGTHGILRHNDAEPKSRWIVGENGRTAELDVESATMPGIFVQGRAEIAAPDRVVLRMRIVNRTDRAIPGIRPLYCAQYARLAGFPQWVDNFRHTHVLIDGEAVALIDTDTENPEADRKGGYVVGAPQHDGDEFPAAVGGLMEKQRLDAAITSVEALAGDRRVLVGWTPGKSMLSNAAIPCIHGDPYYGAIAAGESAEAEGVVWFTDRSVDEALKQLAEEGVGAPLDEWRQ